MHCEGGRGSHLPDSTLRRIWGTDPASKGVRPLSIQKSRHPAAQMSTSAPHPGRQERHVKGCMHQRQAHCLQERKPQLSWTAVQGSTLHSAAGVDMPKQGWKSSHMKASPVRAMPSGSVTSSGAMNSGVPSGSKAFCNVAQPDMIGLFECC